MTPSSDARHPDAGRSGDVRVEELERRIEELLAADDGRFGRFGAADWAACIAFALVLPIALLLWFAR